MTNTSMALACSITLLCVDWLESIEALPIWLAVAIGAICMVMIGRTISRIMGGL